MKPVTVLASLSLALLLTSGAAPPPSDIRPVRTIVVTPQAEGESVSLTGHIRARTEENLAFRIDGRMITRKVDVGAVVKLGDLVAELDPQPRQDALRSAQAALAAALASLHEATNNLERQRTLVGQGWTTRVQYDATEKAFLSAKAEVDSNAAQVHTAEDQLGYTKLLADSDGAVIATGAEAGEVVRAGQMVVTVAHGDGADAVFDVPASLLATCGSPEAVIPLSDQFWAWQPNMFNNLQAAGDAKLQQTSSLPRNQQMKAIADLAGMTDFFASRGISKDQGAACLADTAKADALAKQTETAGTKYNVSGTPTFFINDAPVGTADWAMLDTKLQAAGAR